MAKAYCIAFLLEKFCDYRLIRENHDTFPPQTICNMWLGLQPYGHKKSPIFSSLLYHNLQTANTNNTKSLSLLQNLVGFLLKFTEV